MVAASFVQTQTSQQRYGKYTFFRQNFLQHEFSSRKKLKMGIRKCSPKKVVLRKQNSKRSISRKTKVKHFSAEKCFTLVFLLMERFSILEGKLTIFKPNPYMVNFKMT